MIVSELKDYLSGVPDNAFVTFVTAKEDNVRTDCFDVNKIVYTSVLGEDSGSICFIPK